MAYTMDQTGVVKGIFVQKFFQIVYIERFREKSPLFPDNAIHFVLVGTNTIVDILVKNYPVVRF